MTRLSVKLATGADAGVVAELLRSVVEPLEIYSPEARSGEVKKFSAGEIRRRISNDPRSVYLLGDGEEPCGFAITDDQHGPIWIEWYGVLASHRGLGGGEALMMFLIEDARQNRFATKLWCDTRINNTASMALFEKLGFRKLCELSNHWYRQDFFLWERSL